MKEEGRRKEGGRKEEEELCLVLELDITLHDLLFLLSYCSPSSLTGTIVIIITNTNYRFKYTLPSFLTLAESVEHIVAEDDDRGRERPLL